MGQSISMPYGTIPFCIQGSFHLHGSDDNGIVSVRSSCCTPLQWFIGNIRCRGWSFLLTVNMVQPAVLGLRESSCQCPDSLWGYIEVQGKISFQKEFNVPETTMQAEKRIAITRLRV